MYLVINELSFEDDGGDIKDFEKLLIALQSKYEAHIAVSDEFDFEGCLMHYRKQLTTLELRFFRTTFYKAISEHLPPKPYDEFYVNGKLGKGCALAFYYDECVLSINSKVIWASDSICGRRIVLDDKNGCVDDIGVIRNISTLEHTEILKNENHFFKMSIKRISSVSDFWKMKDEMFSNLIFCDEVKDKIEAKTPSKLMIDKLCFLLFDINNSLNDNEFIKTREKDSSEPTKQKFKTDYKFMFPDNIKRECYKHIDIAYCDRIYYHRTNDKIYIGKIFGHLPIVSIK
jgi:hypothetical protein